MYGFQKFSQDIGICEKWYIKEYFCTKKKAMKTNDGHVRKGVFILNDTSSV